MIFRDADVCNLWNLVNVDFIWNNAMQRKVVQCSWHSFPILWFWFWFNFFRRHRLTVLLKKVIIHATLSYLCKPLRELPQSVCFVWFSHLSILEWRQWSHLTFNQSIEIPRLVSFFFCLKTSTGENFDLPLCSLEAHARCASLPQCKALRHQLLSFIMTS